MELRSSNRRRSRSIHNLTLRQKTASVVFGGYHPWDTIFNGVILVMIVINVILFILSTEQSIRDVAEGAFDGIEYFFVGVFTIELGLRLWTCVEKKYYKRHGPVGGRLRFCINPYTIIDFLAILPFYIQLFLPSDDRLTFITAIRMFRVFRLFKAEKYSRAISILTAVVKNNREVLLTTLVIGIILFVCTSTALYLAERSSQPQLFGSIPSTMYTAVMLLTGLDVPKEEILTETGKVIVGLTAVFSVAVFAVPAGILGWGFESVGEKFQEKRKEKKKKVRRLQRGEKSISTESDGLESEWSVHLSSDSDDSETDETEPLVESTDIQAHDCCPTCKRPF